MSCSVETDQLLTVLFYFYFSVKSIGLLVLLDEFDLDENPLYRTEKNFDIHQFTIGKWLYREKIKFA